MSEQQVTPETQPSEKAEAPQNLHWSTVFIPFLRKAPSLVVSLTAAGYFMGAGITGLLAFWYVLPFVAAYHVARYFTFQYQLGNQELLIRSGIFWRQERRIPIQRIQDVKVQQGPFDQIFGVAKVQITTAGSEEEEAALDVVSKEEALRLKAVLFRQPAASVPADPDLAPTEPTAIVRLSIADLLLGGLTSRLVATLGAIVGAVVYFKLVLAAGGNLFTDWENFVPEMAQWPVSEFEGWPRLLLSPLTWDDTLAGSLLLVLGGLLLSLTGFGFRYFHYSLTRSENVLTKRHGLLTVHSASLVRDRVQALKIEEGLLRRWFGLAAVWADSGGDRNQLDDQKKRDPLVPVIQRKGAYQVARETLPGLTNPEPIWRRVSKRAIFRGSKIGWLLLLVVMVPNLLASISLHSAWLALACLPGFPLVYLLNVQWYRNRGYWLDDHFLMSRKGWFNRETLYLPVRNVQNVSVTQNYFDRRLKLATLSVDTAGQTNTGGGPRIRNLPINEALRIQQTLISRVAFRPERLFRSVARP